jgi:hypothetical protein
LPLTPVAPEAAAAIQVRRNTLRMKTQTTDRREQCWPRSDFAQANSSLRVGASRLMSVVSKPGPHLLAAATDLVVWYYLRHTREDCPMLGLRGSRGRDSSVARYPLLPASARSHSAQRLGMHFSNSRHKGLSWSSAAPQGRPELGLHLGHLPFVHSMGPPCSAGIDFQKHSIGRDFALRWVAKSRTQSLTESKPIE